jgi:hypothetical protein
MRATEEVEESGARSMAFDARSSKSGMNLSACAVETNATSEPGAFKRALT